MAVEQFDRRVVEIRGAVLDLAFAGGPPRSPPIIALPLRILLAELAEEYVFAELCEALTLSLAAENEARMRAMTAAKSNVARMLDELVARTRRLRQEEITSEIIELGSGRGGERRGTPLLRASLD